MAAPTTAIELPVFNFASPLLAIALAYAGVGATVRSPIVGQQT